MVEIQLEPGLFDKNHVRPQYLKVKQNRDHLSFVFLSAKAKSSWGSPGVVPWWI